MRYKLTKTDEDSVNTTQRCGAEDALLESVALLQL